MTPAAERKRLSRERRGMRQIELPVEVIDAIGVIRERDGDPSNVAAASRVLLKEAARIASRRGRIGGRTA